MLISVEIYKLCDWILEVVGLFRKLIDVRNAVACFQCNVLHDFNSCKYTFVN